MVLNCKVSETRLRTRGTVQLPLRNILSRKLLTGTWIGPCHNHWMPGAQATLEDTQISFDGNWLRKHPSKPTGLQVLKIYACKTNSYQAKPNWWTLEIDILSLCDFSRQLGLSRLLHRKLVFCFRFYCPLRGFTSDCFFFQIVYIRILSYMRQMTLCYFKYQCNVCNLTKDEMWRKNERLTF